MSNDLIDRQVAIDAVCMEWCNVKHQNCEHPFDVEKDDYYWCDGCETALQTLPDLPSAQPDRKVGKWIDYSDDGYVECPFCRSATNCDGNINELHYCFSCGAKMEEK